jgi:hypothetical protein
MMGRVDASMGRHDVSCCAVAVSGDRLRNAANRLQLEMWLRCVCAPSLREFMHRARHRRSLLVDRARG